MDARQTGKITNRGEKNMKMRLRSRLSLLFLSFAMVLGLPAMALADVVTVSDANTLQASGDTTKQSGQTGTARFHLLANDNDTDPINNCNANASNKVKVTVEQSAKNASGQSISSPVTFASPGYVELEGCDDASTANTIEFAKTLGYTVGSSAQVGDVITVTGKASGGRTLGNGTTGTFSYDTFKITVVAPPEQGTALTVSAASGTYGGDAELSAKLSSGSTNLAGKQVDFELNGVSVGSATTGTDGVAKRTVSLGSIGAGGPYVDAVSASYAGTGSQCSTGCYGSSDGKAALTIDKAALTVSTDNKSKTYGDANPSFTGGITGIKNSDNITASRASEATSASAVGNYPITATLSYPGNKLSNYNVTNSGGTLTVGKRPITVTADAQSKTYGQNDPNLTHKVTSGSLVGTDGFTGALSRASGEDVGSYVIGQGSLSAGANYDLRYVGANLTIGAKQLSGSFTAESKTYDGNTDARIASRELSGVVGNDDVSLSGGTATFNDKNVGTGKPVTGSNFSLSGAAKDNYTLGSVSNTTANITKKSVSGSFTAENKVYDGNNSATVTGRELSGRIAGDTVSLTGGSATFADKNVGTDKVVTLAGASLDGSDAGNYDLTSVDTANANITAKSITGSFTASNKVYDGTTSATVTGRDLAGTITGDDVKLDGGSASFANKDAGNGKTVNGTGFGLAGAARDNYTLASGTLTTTADISKAPLAVKAKDASKVYGEPIDQRFNGVEYSGFVTGENEGVLGGSLSLSTDATATSPAGGDYYIRPAGLTSGNYEISFADGKLTVTKAQATISLSDLDHTYDATAKAATVTTNPDSPNKQLTVTYDGNAQAPTNAGSYRVVASLNDNNYEARDATSTLVIGQAPLTVKADNNSRAYGDANPSLTGTLTGVKGNDAITTSYSTTADATSPVGDYPIAADVNGTQAALANYDITRTNGTLTVNKRAIEVTADNKNKTYGDADPQLTYRVTNGDLVNNDAFSGGLSRAAGQDVGSYPIDQGTLSAGGNYTLTFKNGTLTIDKAALTVAADNASKSYGDANPNFTGTLTGVKGNDQISASYSTTANASSNVGTYPIVAALSGDKLSNYTVTKEDGTLTITKRAITVTADAGQSKVYGQADPTLTYKLTSGNLIGTDGFNGALSRQAGETVAGSPYAIGVGTLTAGGNYNLTFVGDKFEITKRPIAVSADAQSKVYGQADPTLTYKLTSGNLIGTDGFNGALSRQAGETVAGSPYAIGVGTLSAGGNYDLTFNGADLTITKKSLTGGFTAKGKVYDGDRNAEVDSKSLPGVVGQDQVNLDLTNVLFEDKNVGTAKIVSANLALSGAAKDNYSLSSATATAKADITKKSLTGTFTAENKVYDGTTNAKIANHTLNGVVDGDQVSLAIRGAEFDTKNVGTEKVVTVTTGDLTGAQEGNYSLAGTWTTTADITKRAITVSADAQSKVYGQNDPALTYKLTSGSLANNEILDGSGGVLSGSLTRNSGENVGTYAINKSTLAANGNYEMTFNGANLTITKKQLTVTAQNADKIYGEANPAFQVIYDGFTNGDDKSKLGGGLDFDTAATTASPVGHYDVTPKGLTSGNYDIVFVKGDLKIQMRPISVAADAGQSKVYGQNDQALTYKLTDGSLVNGDSFRGALGRQAGENVGQYAIGQGTLTAGGNYNLTFVGDKFEITKRSITVAADAGQGKVYGQNDPALTYKLTSGNLIGTDGFSGALSRDPGENVGSYSIGQGSLTAGNNYNLTVAVAGADFSITKRAITVSADAQSKVYGQNDPSLTYGVGGLGLAQGDTRASVFTGSLTRDAGENVGSYAINQGTLAANGNYEMTFNGANLAITKKAIEVTADAKNKLFGAADPALTYKVTNGGLVNNDAFAGSLERQVGENVGSYVIRQGSLTAGNNYEMSFVENTLKIVYGSGFNAIHQPINGGTTPSLTAANTDAAFGDDNSRFKLGSTVPVKFTLKDANGAPVSNAVAKLTLKKADATPDPGVDEATSTAASTTGNLFRYDAMSGQYIFNLSTKAGYTNPSGTTVSFGPGTYTLTVVLDDGTTRSVNINIVK